MERPKSERHTAKKLTRREKAGTGSKDALGFSLPDPHLLRRRTRVLKLTERAQRF
jgi:hypothetical protein